MPEKAMQKENEPADMRAHILDVASKLVDEKGVRETSLKEIADAAGISKGTLYYYYAAKEDIIYAMADRNMTIIAEGLVSWIEAANLKLRPAEIFKEAFERILEEEAIGRLHLYLLNDVKTTDGKLTARYKEWYGRWRKVLKYGLGKVLPQRERENAALSYLVLAALDGLIIQKMCGVEDIPIDDIVALLLQAK